MNRALLEILACPICKGELLFDRTNNELVCRYDRLCYAIVNERPVLTESKARQLTVDEL